MLFRVFYGIIGSILMVVAPAFVWGQTSKITADLQKDKPEQYKSRKLRSERTNEKKFGTLDRFLQNTTSHYNYYFNADRIVNSVVENARKAQKDDYNKMLSYYPYSLNYTATRKTDLDSVIQKSTAGILLHDLRSNWVDNFYLLIGKAYFFEKKFDSAYMAFQFINFNLRPDQKKNQYLPEPVGTNLKNQSHIATAEDRSLSQKMTSLPPSRNDALLWQIRSLTEMDLYDDASGIINNIQNDSNFPDRLVPDFYNVRGYWFFRQEMYDSALQYLSLSLPFIRARQDRARTEFLIAQLYENKNSFDTAQYYYGQAEKHATDPLMNIYANLRQAKLLDKGQPQDIRKGIAKLLQMSKKDKYYDYRHIIYYSAGQLAMDIPDTLFAIKYFQQSARLNNFDPNLKGKTFLTLAHLDYETGKYEMALNAYDSLFKLGLVVENPQEINETRDYLSRIVGNITKIKHEDSLQMVASMPTAERESYLKKLSKKLRKERGINDDRNDDANTTADISGKNQNNTDLFSASNAGKGWYFSDTKMKSQGYGEFKRLWGNRQNVDNWRTVSSATSMAAKTPSQQMAPQGDPTALQPVDTTTSDQTDDISVTGLRNNLPLTQPQLDLSNEKIAEALFDLGKNYQDLLGDYKSAISAYLESLKRFPDKLYDGDLYLNLGFCYRQIGNMTLAEKYSAALKKEFPESKSALLMTGVDKREKTEKDSLSTAMYDKIYGLFIQGNFDEALALKDSADSLYGETHWDPQLSYIEAVYYIRQRQDSTAISLLGKLAGDPKDTLMKEKAQNLISVLKRRNEIENYLTNLQIERLPDDSVITVFDDTRIYGNLPVRQVRDDNNLLPSKVSVAEKPVLNEGKKLPSPVQNKSFTLDPFSTQNVVMILTDVDPIYISEAQRALAQYTRTKFYGQKIAVRKDTLDTHQKLLIFSNFISGDEALKFIDKISKDARQEISWLPAKNYAFYFISDDNLHILKENKNLEDYINLLKQKYPKNF